MLLFALTGCITLPRTSFTQAEEGLASPAGFDHVRYANDDPALPEMLRRTLRPNARAELNVLAISGGGANGAYGAGVISSWTGTGKRPTFELVTGVSTGALTAPFAFLGPGWDDELRQTYFTPGIAHLLQQRGLLGLFTPGLYRKAPLNDLVRRDVTDDLIRAVAVEHAKGRRLLVGTTNLDTEKLIVWDMGAIAAHGGPKARELFTQVLVASASVPGVFSPSLIKVEAGGHAFSEMHVDGQAESAFLSIPQTLLLSSRPDPLAYRAHLYILVNSRLDDPFAVTPSAAVPILARAFDTASRASLWSVVIAGAEFCERANCDFLVAAMPTTVADSSLDFSDAHMQSLFAAGQDAIATGQAWKALASTTPERTRRLGAGR